MIMNNKITEVPRNTKEEDLRIFEEEDFDALKEEAIEAGINTTHEICSFHEMGLCDPQDESSAERTIEFLMSESLYEPIEK